ncbi:MAG: glycosyltransferase family 2 protein [Bacteroidota bacterium]
MVGMILITLDFLHNTRECIASLQRTTSYPYVLTVVDNASTDATCDFLAENGIEVIRNPSRVHLSVALNQGLRRQLARPEVDCVCWIHNDMRFYPGWLENLVREFGSDPRIGKLAPYNILNEGRADEAFALEFMAAHRGQARQAYEVPWVMPRRVVEQVGFYDEGYLACGGYEEWDYNNRIIDAGYLVAATFGSVVWHETMGTRRHFQQVAEAHANAQRYLSRWGQLGPRL